jgi:hypothetical protein
MFMFGASNVKVWGCAVESSVVITSPGGNNVLATPGALNGTTWTVSNQISVSNRITVPAFKTFFAQAAAGQSSQFTEAVLPGVNAVSLKYRFTVEAGAAGAGTATAVVGTPWIVAIPF